MNFYWLIELRPAFEGHPAFNPTYYAGWQVSPVEAAKTYDVHASPKFTRKKDAETVADALGACHTLSCVWKAVEHGFDTSAVETTVRPSFEGSLCEHVPAGYACEICNHDGVAQ
jgi:hypothetical protein